MKKSDQIRRKIRFSLWTMLIAMVLVCIFVAIATAYHTPHMIVPIAACGLCLLVAIHRNSVLLYDVLTADGEEAHLTRACEFNRFWRLLAGPSIAGGLAADESDQSALAEALRAHTSLYRRLSAYHLLEPGEKPSSPKIEKTDEDGLTNLGQLLYGATHTKPPTPEQCEQINGRCHMHIYGENGGFHINFLKILARFAEDGLEAVLYPEDDPAVVLLRPEVSPTETLLRPAAKATYQIPEEQLLHVTAGE